MRELHILCLPSTAPSLVLPLMLLVLSALAIDIDAPSSTQSSSRRDVEARALRELPPAASVDVRRIEAVYHFAQAGDVVVTSDEMVLEGVIIVDMPWSGQFHLDSIMAMDQMVMEVLASVVGIGESAVLLTDNAVFFSANNSDPNLADTYELRYSFALLPPLGGSEGARRAIFDSGKGGASEMPPFQVMLRTKMSMEESTVDLSVRSWEVRIPWPEAVSRKVRRPQMYATYSTTQYTLDWATGDNAPSPSFVIDQCGRISEPCGCAAFAHCTWFVDAATGIADCREGSASSSGVSCEHCTGQDHCPGFACLRILDACSCTASSSSCYWDVSFYKCSMQTAGATNRSTPCRACPTQDHCEPPEVKSVEPKDGTVLRAPAALELRVEFDKAVELQYTGSVSFECEGQYSEINAPREHLVLEGDTVLVIDLARLIAASSEQGIDKVRACDLIISPGRVLDTDGVPFLGMEKGEYTFKLGDTTPPRVARYEPSNGARDVPHDTEVTLKFSEDIKLDRAMDFVTLSALEIEDTGGSSGDDGAEAGTVTAAPAGSSYSDGSGIIAKEEGQIRLSSAQVELSDDTLRISLEGLAKPGMFYSLSLPRGAVADLSSNEFQGLDVGAYAFRTAPAAIEEESGESSDGLPVGVIAVVAGVSAVCLALCVGVLVRIALLRRQHTTYVDRRTAKMSTVRPADAEAPAPSIWEKGSFSKIPTDRGQPDGTATWSPGAQFQRSKTFAGTSGVASAPVTGRQSVPAAGVGITPGSQQPLPRAATANAGFEKQGSSVQGARAGPASEPTTQWAQRTAAGGASSPTSPLSPKTTKRQSTRAETSPNAKEKEAAGRSEKRRATVGAENAAADSSTGSRASVGGTSRAADRAFSEAAADSESPELRKAKEQIEKRMRDMMDAPIADRKKALKDFMLEYHPDKNKDPWAKDVFQFINSSRSWFMCETS